MTADEIIAEIKPEILETLKILMLHQHTCPVKNNEWCVPHKCITIAPRIFVPIPKSLVEGVVWEDVLAHVSSWKWVASVKEYDNEPITDADGDIEISFQDRRTLEVVSKSLKDITFED